LPVLTPAERRAALLLTLLLVLGAARDAFEARRLARAPHAAPVAAAAVAPDTTSPAPAATAPAAGPLDLNRATAADLDALPGVGPVLASRILEHRRRFGSFRAVDDLRAVRGIGPRLFERLRPRVCVGPGG